MFIVDNISALYLTIYHFNNECATLFMFINFNECIITNIYHDPILSDVIITEAFHGTGDEPYRQILFIKP